MYLRLLYAVARPPPVSNCAITGSSWLIPNPTSCGVTASPFRMSCRTVTMTCKLNAGRISTKMVNREAIRNVQPLQPCIDVALK